MIADVSTQSLEVPQNFKLLEEDSMLHTRLVQEVRAMNLTLPAEDAEDEYLKEESLFEDEETLEYLANHLAVVAELDLEEPASTLARNRSVILTRDFGGDMDPELLEYKKALVAALHRDFDGTVLRKDVPPENLIPRGPHGEGTIKIKPGYMAKKQRPIHLTGEKLVALTALVKGWKEQGKVEEGQGEWSSPAFVVSKKNGKWRGVVDF